MRLGDDMFERGVAHLAEGVENVVEVDQDLALCDLGNVVHGLAGVVSNASILVSEAGKHWRYNDFEISSKLLSVITKTQSGVSGCPVRGKGSGIKDRRTEPRAMAAAASPIRPPFRA